MKIFKFLCLKKIFLTAYLFESDLNIFLKSLVIYSLVASFQAAKWRDQMPFNPTHPSRMVSYLCLYENAKGGFGWADGQAGQ